MQKYVDIFYKSEYNELKNLMFRILIGFNPVKIRPEGVS